MTEFDFTEIVKNIGPLIGLIFGIYLIYKLALSDDAGKKITDQLQKSKLGIADLFLLIFAFLEGLVAANMGSDALGDTYTTRFVNHIALALAGAFAGFICIKEVIDVVNKFNKKKDGKRIHGALYLTVQTLQPIIYFLIAASMPIFNLIIISKGTGDFTNLSFLIGSEYSFSEIFGALQDVTARSLIMVLAHISLTFAVAVGSIDDIDPIESESKKSKNKNKDKDLSDEERAAAKKAKKEEREADIPSLDEAKELMGNSLGNINSTQITLELARIPAGESKINLLGKIQEYAKYKKLNLERLSKAQNVGKKSVIEKIRKDIEITDKNFERLWEKIKEQAKN